MLRGDGKSGEKASAKTLVSNANATAPPPAPEKPATALDTEPIEPNLPPPADDGKSPRIKTKHRLVLKAVSDVKELRSKAAKPAPKVATASKSAKPKKGAKAALLDEPFDSELKAIPKRK